MEKIIVKGGKLVTFSDCVFHSAPTVSIEENTCVKFADCYTRDGEAVKAE